MIFTGLDLLRNRKATYDSDTKGICGNYFNPKDDTLDYISSIIDSSRQTVICIDDKIHNNQIQQILSTIKRPKYLQFLSLEAAQFLGTLYDFRYQAFYGETISYITDRRSILCQIWKKFDSQFEAIGSYPLTGDQGDDEKNLKNLSQASNGLKGIDIAFIDKVIDKRVFEQIFPKVKYRQFEYGGDLSEVALLKARINDGDEELKKYDVQNTLNRRITVSSGIKTCLDIVMGQSLPLTKEGFIDNCGVSTFKVTEGSIKSMKTETNFLLPLSPAKKLPVTLTLSKNALLETVIFKNSFSYHSSLETLKANLSIPFNAEGKDESLSDRPACL